MVRGDLISLGARGPQLKSQLPHFPAIGPRASFLNFYALVFSSLKCGQLHLVFVTGLVPWGTHSAYVQEILMGKEKELGKQDPTASQMQHGLKRRVALQTEAWRGTQERVSATNTPQSWEMSVQTHHLLQACWAK